MKESPVIYTDVLSVSLLLFLLPELLQRKVKKIFFQKRTNSAFQFHSFLLRTGLVDSPIEPFEYHLWEFLDAQGGSLFPHVLEKTNAICSALREQVNSEIAVAPPFFSKKDFVLFLDKAAWEDVYRQVVCVLAIQRHKRNLGEIGSVSCYFRYHYIFRGNVFFRVMESNDIRLSAYSDLNVFSKLQPIGRLAKKFFRGIIASHRKPKRKYDRPPQEAIPARKANLLEKGSPEDHGAFSEGVSSTSCIAALYMGKTISFNPDERSDFFWFLNSDLPKDKMIVVFWRNDIPITDEDLDLLDNNRIRYWFIGRNSPNRRIPCWGPARIRIRSLLGLVRWVVFFLIGHPFSAVACYLPEVFRLFYGFVLWHEFFISQGVRLGYFPNDFDKFSIAIHCAVRSSGGVGVSNQFSNIWFSSGILSSNAEVLFAFSPHYEKFWKENGSVLSTIVHTGYVTDHSFLATKSKSLQLRKKLLNRGVKTIIGFFDENSSDDPCSVIGNQRVADLYSFFLQWVINDGEIGFIFKPGYPKTLISRIPGCSHLIQKALETGRCLFVADGKYVTNQYPCEVAQSSDLAVGLYLAGTAALESILAGTPTVFLDLEKMYLEELYTWGREEVVFDSLEGLRAYITKQRAGGYPFRIHPRLMQWARERDPFRDGQASRRIGQYLEVIFKELAQGRAKAIAIEKANRAHQERWGKESVSVWK